MGGPRMTSGSMPAACAEVASAAEVAGALERLGASPELIAQVTAARQRLDSARPELRADILRFHRDIIAGIGDVRSKAPRAVRVRADDGAAGAFANVFGLLTGMPHLQAYYRSKGLDESLLWDTLVDLPRHILRHRLLQGSDGMANVGWLHLHFRGLLLAFGRLQVQRARSCATPWDRLALTRAIGRLGAHGILYNLHIPAGGGLSPERIDASLAASIETYGRAFPEERPVAFTCFSWLLDPHLADALPPDSNIVRFLRRFRIVGAGQPANRTIVAFVFDVPGRTPLDRLPQETTLQQAVVERIRAGGRWRVRTGWFPVERPSASA